MIAPLTVLVQSATYATDILLRSEAPSVQKQPCETKAGSTLVRGKATPQPTPNEGNVRILNAAARSRVGRHLTTPVARGDTVHPRRIRTGGSVLYDRRRPHWEPNPQILMA